MLRRKALEEFAAWRDEHGNRALLVTGARQVGKTYLVREFLHAEYENVGEVDFVCESGGGAVLPVEVKSGKDYKRRSALGNVLGSPNCEIEQATVLCEGNVNEDGKAAYLPVYMIMFV